DHSGPKDKRYDIELITNKKSKKIYLRQNNMDTTLFWVYDYTYKTSIMNDIGIIRTEILERY
ncbi:MAG: hypothetical protein GXO80_09935, partial [Chlorobi bacterium]|nr:hypothetical protein [Chlorobiota bacterium]